MWTLLPLCFLDVTYTDALPSALVREVVAETLPDGRAALTLLFADGQARTYRIADADVRRRLVGVLRAALPLCLDPTPPVLPGGDAGDAGAAPPARDAGAAASAPQIFSIAPVLYRNAVVVRVSAGVPANEMVPGEIERRVGGWWVIGAGSVQRVEEALRSGFPGDSWPAEKVERVPSTDLRGSWLASVSRRDPDRPLVLEYALMGEGWPPFETGHSWRASPPLTAEQMDAYSGRVLQVAGEKRGETILVETIEVRPGSLF